MVARHDYNYVKNFVENNSNCKLLSKEYVNASTNLLFKCECGIEFETRFNTFQFRNKRQCNKCGRQNSSNRKTKTNKEFTEEVYALVGEEYVFLEEYKGVQNKILCKHNTDKCGCEYFVRPNHFLTGSRCPRCYGYSGRVSKTHDQFLYECEQIVGDQYSILGTYINARTPILLRHNECGHEYLVTPNNFLNAGRRCPQCTESKGEKEIREFLSKQNITNVPQYKFEDCRNIYPLPFDFYLPDYNLLIEYDGEQHYKPINFGGCSNEEAEASFKQIKYNDNIKNEYCSKKNIKLIRIPYWRFDDIEEILSIELKSLTDESGGE